MGLNELITQQINRLSICDVLEALIADSDLQEVVNCLDYIAHKSKKKVCLHDEKNPVEIGSVDREPAELVDFLVEENGVFDVSFYLHNSAKRRGESIRTDFV